VITDKLRGVHWGGGKSAGWVWNYEGSGFSFHREKPPGGQELVSVSVREGRLASWSNANRNRPGWEIGPKDLVQGKDHGLRC